jgi:ABC-type multidrug transport system ATPase subunit
MSWYKGARPRGAGKRDDLAPARGNTPESAPTPDPTPSSSPSAAAPPAQPGGAVVPAGRPLAGWYRTGRAIVAGGEQSITLGRSPDHAAGQVSHPQVSTNHAAVERRSDGKWYVRDLGSQAGTFVRGRQIRPNTPVPVEPGEAILLGAIPVHIAAPGEPAAPPPKTLPTFPADRVLFEVEAYRVSVDVPDGTTGDLRRILHDVTLKALPGDLVALMGPSGAGKTTLLSVLNGFVRPAEGGSVRVNGRNIADAASFDALRGFVGYVPQDDLVHPELTVREAVTYAARLRLPPDTTAREIERRVEATLASLGLTRKADDQIGRPERKTLSGGERKRVNIAVELVTDPPILFLDEPTSGLASDDTAALVDLLARLARDEGRTVICTIHQPAKEEFERFSHALILGFGGVVGYFGPTGVPIYDFYERFRRTALPALPPVSDPRSLFAVIHARERIGVPADVSEVPPAERKRAAEAWRAEFFDQGNPISADMSRGARAVVAQPEPGAEPPRRRHHGQLATLMSRYLTVKVRDKAGFWVLALQAPLIALLVGATFKIVQGAPVNLCPALSPEVVSALSDPGALRAAGPDLDRRVRELGAAGPPLAGHFRGSILFFLVVAAVWFGASNASQEIVTEQAIFRRERMVNLRLGSYLASKFLSLALIAMLQALSLGGGRSPRPRNGRSPRRRSRRTGSGSDRVDEPRARALRRRRDQRAGAALDPDPPHPADPLRRAGLPLQGCRSPQAAPPRDANPLGLSGARLARVPRARRLRGAARDR